MSPDATTRKRRAGRREANLRQLNERIADAQHDAGIDEDALHLVCECSREQCEDGLLVPASVFEQVRANAATRFVVAEGHVLHDIEDAVQTGAGWVVVEKRGTAARAATQELR